MFVLKKIGPVVIGTSTHRFLVGEKLTEDQIEFFKKSRQFEELFKAGIIGERVSGNEPVRQSESGQQKDSDDIAGVDTGSDSDQPAGSKRSGKR